MPQEKIVRKYNSHKKYNIIIGDGKVENLDRNEWNIFTDGSKGKEGTGAGFLVQVPGKEDKQGKIPLGKWATVNQAEMLAIEEGTRCLKGSSQEWS